MLKSTAVETLVHARYRAGLTLEALADRAKVSVATISNIETGQVQSPYGRTIYKLAEALDIDPETLFEREAAS